LVTALWHEARGESLQGIQAVASVVTNRTTSSQYPDTICKVVKQDKQFSNIEQTFNTGINPKNIPEQKALFAINKVAYKVVFGEFKPTVPALHYHVVGHKVYWSRGFTKRKVIGRPVFGVIESRLPSS
jgi:spore germination cell wall hydrolase CwlJ-like protein